MEDLSMNDLQRLAALSREKELYQTTKDVVQVRQMTERRVRRAKDRQDQYLFLKALAVTLQTVCVMLICFMGIFTFFEVRNDSESSFYATQLTIEHIVLLITFTVVLFEVMVLRVLMILAYVVVLFLNILQITYFMLFSRHESCKNIEFPFGKILCVSQVVPVQHHSTFAAGILALFHLCLAIIAIAVATKYQGSISEIVESTDPESLQRFYRYRQKMREKRRAERRRQKRQRSRTRRRSSRRSRSSQRLAVVPKQTFRPKSPMLSKYTKLDITKLPDGTRFKTTDNKTFNMEYYVEDGVFVGSGTETVNKAISICAPIRPQQNRQKQRPGRDASSQQSIENRNKLIEQEARDLQ